MGWADTTELFGLSLTAASVVMAVAVVALWWESSIKALRRKKPRPEDWVTRGVFLKHIGDILDNAYWFLAWAAQFILAPAAIALMTYGFIPNIPSRNIVLIVASICYLQGYFSYRGMGIRPTVIICVGAGVIGVLAGVALLYVRSAALWG